MKKHQGKKKRPFTDFFKDRIHFMVNQAEGLSNLEHRGLKGRFRELLVRDLLEPLVPKTCSITYGTVVDSKGERYVPNKPRKTEDDILIVDRECLPPFFEYEKEGIYPIESVLARIEVKSYINSNEIKDAVNGAYQFSQLEPNIPNIKEYELMQTKTVQVLFGYKSTLSNPKDIFFEELDNAVKEENEPKIERSLPVIRHFCIPGLGYWVYTKDDDRGKEAWYFCKANKQDKYREVLAFIALLLQELPGVREVRRKATLGKYIKCLLDDKLQEITEKETGK